PQKSLKPAVSGDSLKAVKRGHDHRGSADPTGEARQEVALRAVRVDDAEALAANEVDQAEEHEGIAQPVAGAEIRPNDRVDPGGARLIPQLVAVRVSPHDPDFVARRIHPGCASQRGPAESPRKAVNDVEDLDLRSLRLWRHSPR